jgi:hypothetical protein
MNPIFKVEDGFYVDLSRIVGVKFYSYWSYGVVGVMEIYFNRDERDLLFKKHKDGCVGFVKVEDFFDKYVLDIIDFCLGPVKEGSIFERDYSKNNIPAAQEIVKNKMIKKYQHLIDAWEKYKNGT